VNSQIEALMRKAESGDDWAEICRLEAIELDHGFVQDHAADCPVGGNFACTCGLNREVKTVPLIEKLQSYGFACEAGPLVNCVDWQLLKDSYAALERELRFQRLNLHPRQWATIDAALGTCSASPKDSEHG
jgi:hypothetical protein